MWTESGKQRGSKQNTGKKYPHFKNSRMEIIWGLPWLCFGQGGERWRPKYEEIKVQVAYF